MAAESFKSTQVTPMRSVGLGLGVGTRGIFGVVNLPNPGTFDDLWLKGRGISLRWGMWNGGEAPTEGAQVLNFLGWDRQKLKGWENTRTRARTFSGTGVKCCLLNSCWEVAF